jgi:sterol desaturase/sphingolipid hydroxylase (fatty acid hydroxylase superfamily)
VKLIAALLLLALFFRLIEGRWVFRRERKTDLLYWFFTPVVTKSITAIALGVIFVLSGASPMRETWFTSLPAGLQFVLVLVAADLLGYASHRLFHGRVLWRFHAIHHSAAEPHGLDWLAATRLHPLNEIGQRLLQVLPLYLLGFRGDVVAGAVPFLSLYAIFLHADVSWDFGPLRYVIASPRFHRWHHALDDEAIDRNFAGLFPWIDLAFGTFHMPCGRQPARFGVREPVPAGLLAQLTFPFRGFDK